MILGIVDVLKSNKLIVSILTVILLITSIVIMWVIKGKQEKIKTNEVAIIGVFTALSIVLYFLKFNLPFLFPSFLEINFSMLPIIIIGFMYGPIEGMSIVLLRCIIKIPFTSTFCVGEVADMLIGIPVVLVSSIIYLKFHSKKGALISLGLGMCTWIIASIFANYFINVPFFIELYFGGNIEGFVSILSIIPGVTVENYMSKYLLLAVLPFNALLSIIVSVVTFLVYKKISILFDRITHKKDILVEE